MSSRTIAKLVVLVLLAGLAALPASAEFYVGDKTSSDPNRPYIEGLAKEFASIAASFGCALAWGQMNNESSATMEFVPAGHDVRKWARLVTITTLALPAKEPERPAVLKRLQAIMLSTYSQNGTIVETKEGTDAKGSKTLFVEYDLGAGAATEHNAAAIIKLRSDLAGIVQIQSRGKPLAREDAAKIMSLANIKQN